MNALDIELEQLDSNVFILRSKMFGLDHEKAGFVDLILADLYDIADLEVIEANNLFEYAEDSSIYNTKLSLILEPSVTKTLQEYESDISDAMDVSMAEIQFQNFEIDLIENQILDIEVDAAAKLKNESKFRLFSAIQKPFSKYLF